MSKLPIMLVYVCISNALLAHSTTHIVIMALSEFGYFPNILLTEGKLFFSLVLLPSSSGDFGLSVWKKKNS